MMHLNRLKSTEMKKISKILAFGVFPWLAVACQEEPDDSYSRFNSQIELSVSSESVVLNEDTPDEVALTVSWNPAYDYGSDFLTTYEFKTYLVGGSVSEISEYEDAGNFERSWTHKELQDLLVGTFGQLTSTTRTLRFTISASFEGPYIVIPDEDVITVSVKTYGDKQFDADRVFLSGSAVGDEDVELTASSDGIYVWNGALSAGKFNFPVIYEDENNVIVPESLADTPVGDGSMGASVVGQDETGASAGWTVSEAADYRVTLNFSTRSVTVMNAEDILEFEKIYVDGTATDALEETALELTQTLENENLYAWRGELSEGALYLPLEFNGARAMSIVPNGESHDLSDGQTVSFSSASSSATENRYWQIPSAGTYRIVVNTELRTITIYSPNTDLQPKYTSSGWNGEASGYGNPASAVAVECLWMYGTFYNRLASDSGLQTGFFYDYRCMQSLADPQKFVYSGDALPRNTGSDYFGATSTGSVVFYIGPVEPYEGEYGTVQPWNNSYAFGSTADASRAQSRCGYVDATLGVPETLVEGQSDNRYAYFNIPEGCNNVVVDLRNMTVTFNQR